MKEKIRSNIAISLSILSFVVSIISLLISYKYYNFQSNVDLRIDAELQYDTSIISRLPHDIKLTFINGGFKTVNIKSGTIYGSCLIVPAGRFLPFNGEYYVRIPNFSFIILKPSESFVFVFDLDNKNYDFNRNCNLLFRFNTDLGGFNKNIEYKISSHLI